MKKIFQNFQRSLYHALPEKHRETLFVRLFGLFKIPMIFYLSPRVKKLDKKVCEIEIPLNWRTRNHLGSLYFGAFAAGADMAGGLIAMKSILESGENIHLSFKEFKAEFFKRAESHTVFKNSQGQEVREFVKRVSQSDERQDFPLYIEAFCPETLGDEVVGSFELILSLKKKS